MFIFQFLTNLSIFQLKCIVYLWYFHNVGSFPLIIPTSLLRFIENIHYEHISERMWSFDWEIITRSVRTTLRICNCLSLVGRLVAVSWCSVQFFSRFICRLWCSSPLRWTCAIYFIPRRMQSFCAPLNLLTLAIFLLRLDNLHMCCSLLQWLMRYPILLLMLIRLSCIVVDKSILSANEFEFLILHRLIFLSCTSEVLESMFLMFVRKTVQVNWKLLKNEMYWRWAYRHNVNSYQCSWPKYLQHGVEVWRSELSYTPRWMTYIFLWGKSLLNSPEIKRAFVRDFDRHSFTTKHFE